MIREKFLRLVDSCPLYQGLAASKAGGGAIGEDNIANGKQDGVSNQPALTQDGGNNVGVFSQNGTGNNAAISQ